VPLPIVKVSPLTVRVSLSIVWVPPSTAGRQDVPTDRQKSSRYERS
jgi:hypothetical protein